uniref:Uncharacterized protein n=1 Tax=Glossina austeni TaxID=7395 RepID=A0A1A9UQU3_GLOAU
MDVIANVDQLVLDLVHSILSLLSQQVLNGLRLTTTNIFLHICIHKYVKIRLHLHIETPTYVDNRKHLKPGKEKLGNGDFNARKNFKTTSALMMSTVYVRFSAKFDGYKEAEGRAFKADTAYWINTYTFSSFPNPIN